MVQIQLIVCIPAWASLLGFLISFLLTHLISEGKEPVYLRNTCGLLLSLA